MTDEKKLTHIDLFSGIGGFTLAGEWAGFRTIVFCEKDEFCKKVLKKHWPEIPIIKEIRDFDGTKWRGATLLTGGFPCQPFSVAGQRRGKEDDRYLWPEMLKIINEARPHWILAENVPGIFRMALDTVLADLEGEGYIAGTFIIPACSLNAPHRRNRIWILANSRCQHGKGTKNKGKFGKPLFGKENALMPERPIKNDESGVAQNTIGTRTRNQDGKIDNQKRRICQNRRKGIRQKDREISTSGSASTISYATDSKKRDSGKQETRDGWKGFERGDWEKDWYEIATRFCRVDDGIPDRIHRLKALGNAIVPQIAYEILKNIAWIENELAR